jgi:hypothetical protein
VANRVLNADIDRGGHGNRRLHAFSTQLSLSENKPMMLSRTANKSLARLVSRAFSAEASTVASTVTLNFSKPHESIYNGAKVFQVIIPGVEGEYGVTPNHVPYVAQLKPGVLQILHEEGSFADSEKYFVAGGYALTHDNSVTVS